MTGRVTNIRARTETGDVFTMQDVVQLDAHTTVERDVLGIVEWVRDYHPNLDVLYLDPDHFSLTDAPYAIVEYDAQGRAQLVFSCWHLDESVKDRVKAADTWRYDVQGAIDLAEARQRKETEAKWEEEREKNTDVVKHVLANPKGTYSFPNADGEVVTLRDDEGITKRKGSGGES